VAGAVTGAVTGGDVAHERAVSGKWFEELTPGLVVTHAITRTVTEADNTLFSVMTMNPQPLHLDASFAETTEFGQRLVNSMFTLSLLVGMSVYETTLGTTVANLGFGEIAFPKPVFHGDSIHAETEVISARESSSRPTQGIVELEHRAFNQRDELVARVRRSALMRKRPA
jgi:acyl dehydratase